MSDYVPRFHPNLDNWTSGTKFLQMRGLGRVVILPNDTELDNSCFELVANIRDRPLSFIVALPNDLLNQHPYVEGDGTFEIIHGFDVGKPSDTIFNMRVRGNGVIVIKTVDGIHTQCFQIRLQINCSSYVSLALPQECQGKLDISGDGNIHFTTRFEDDFSDISTDFENKDDATEYESSSKKSQNLRHKRNGSDYLQISNSLSETSNESVQEVKTNGEGKGIELVCKSNVDNDAINQKEKLRRNNYDDCDCSVLEKMTKKEIDKHIKVKEKFEKFRNSVVEHNESPWHKGACLKCAIRYNYTFLLNALVKTDLCDHLYEKGIIDLKFCSRQNNLCRKEDYREAVRNVLMFLSTESICHDDFLHALYDSYLYMLIPYFYPGVQI